MTTPAEPADAAEPAAADPGARERELGRRLAQVEEERLNAVDALIGAEAAAAQARRDHDDVFHRLHVREQELKTLKELLGYDLDTPLEEMAAAIESDGRRLSGLARRRSVRAKPRR